MASESEPRNILGGPSGRAQILYNANSDSYWACLGTHSILPTANRSGKSGQVKQGRAQGTEASRGLKIWHILSVAEHYLTSAALQRGKPEEGLTG